MGRNGMNEAETRAELIDPKLKAGGWGVVEGSKILRERNVCKITEGKIQVGGGRKKPLIADYILVYKGIKLAVVEAKSDELQVGEGVAQAKQYAAKLKLETTYSTNGKEIYQICMKTGVEGLVTAFLSPQELWDKTYPSTGSGQALIREWREKFFSIPFEDKSGTWQLRYYQEIAIKNTLEAVAQNKDRILLTLATGTGKTAIAFQIAWKLFQTRWDLNRDGQRRPRILFLADRNILADQAFNAFSTFPEDAMVRIKPKEIKKKGKVPTNGSIFFTIFQSFMASTSSATSQSPATSQSSAISQKNETFIEIKDIVAANGYMYILECSDGSFYTGSTINLVKRLFEHRMGEGPKHTKNRLLVKLVYYETCDRIDEAFNREKQIQKWSKAKKIALINNDIELLKSLSESKANQKVSALCVDLSRPPAEKVSGPCVELSRPPVEKVSGPVEKVSEPVEKVSEPVELNFGQYPKDYFDFIIIDECHRGGANDEGNWRGILEYFSPAVQLGLTATPKRKDNVDTYKYFGEPVYIYSLKEGINDGFLTPFKVKRIQTTLDKYIYTSDDDIVEGEIEEGRWYKEPDFNRIIEIKEREAKRVQIYMDEVNQKEKTIIFCATQIHAAAVRDLVASARSATRKVGEPVEPNYCVRVTANDGERGEQFLREFQDNEKTIPTVLTTSQKLSTGVDARNIRNIVLMRPVNTMIEFKQIVGRGTRLFDGKEFFTIYDFVDAYFHFADPEWDGEALPCEDCGKIVCECIGTPSPEPNPCKVCDQRPCICGNGQPKVCAKCGQRPCICPRKVKVKLRDGKEREIQHMIATSFWSAGGKPISAEEFLTNLFGELPNFFKSEKELRTIWSNPITRKTLLEKLDEAGFGKDELKTLQKLINAEKSDLYDVLEYVFNSDIKPITREERVTRAEATIFALLNDKQKEFIEFVLSKYVETGVEELDQDKLPILLKNKYQSLEDAKEILGDVANISSLFIEFQKYLYLHRAA
jgi:superfamily II DNA or RNA helicase/predicted GIY-YIG superfamily endonuclease